jgi:hypothetical protein
MQNNSAYSGAPYLMGKVGLKNGVKKGFKQYFLIAFLYKVPIATQLILVMALVSLVRDRNQINFWKNEAFLIFPSLLFFTIFSFSNAQLGIRYILLIFPFIFVLCGRAMISWANSKMSYRIFIIILLGYLLVSNLFYFPHYLSYFNELLTDRKLGYTVLVDSNLDWGQNENYLIKYLDENPKTMHTSSVMDPLILKRFPDRVFDPKRPQPGLVVIGANQLVGLSGNQRYGWIKQNLKPVDHIAYGYLIFKIEPQDLPKIARYTESGKG